MDDCNNITLSEMYERVLYLSDEHRIFLSTMKNFDGTWKSLQSGNIINEEVKE